MTKARVKLIAGIAIAALLVTAGVVAAFRFALDRFDHSVPQADLFGSATATPPAQGTGPTTSAEPPAGSAIAGPLNFLIVGTDYVAGDPDRSLPHSDALMIMHIDASLTHAYLTSLPRDLLLDVPANPASGTGATYTKVTNSMAIGAQVPGSDQVNMAQGFALLARTVSAYTGIDHFDAGAVLTFDGMQHLVDAIGGVDIYVDVKTTSIHKNPSGGDGMTTGGPFAVYPVGEQHLVGWQALDFARQRYSLPDGAYGRERHHRQLIKAIVTKIFSFNLLQYPLMAPFIFSSIGDAVTLDLRGRQLHDYVYALRNLRPENLTLVGLPGSSVFSDGNYLGESLNSIESSYFDAVRAGTVGPFLDANPSLINDPR
jgi:LCP family protein required for cell wall assembly